MTKNKRHGLEITTRGVSFNGSRLYHMDDRRGRAYYCDCCRSVDLSLRLRQLGINKGTPGARRIKFKPMEKRFNFEMNMLAIDDRQVFKGDIEK